MGSHKTPENMIRDRALLSEINRLAHALCRREYGAIRADLLAELDRMQAAGATFSEMSAALTERARQAPARAPDDA